MVWNCLCELLILSLLYVQKNILSARAVTNVLVMTALKHLLKPKNCKTGTTTMSVVITAQFFSNQLLQTVVVS